MKIDLYSFCCLKVTGYSFLITISNCLKLQIFCKSFAFHNNYYGILYKGLPQSMKGNRLQYYHFLTLVNNDESNTQIIEF